MLTQIWLQNTWSLNPIYPALSLSKLYFTLDSFIILNQNILNITKLSTVPRTPAVFITTMSIDQLNSAIQENICLFWWRKSSAWSVYMIHRLTALLPLTHYIRTNNQFMYKARQCPGNFQLVINIKFQWNLMLSIWPH